MAEFSGKNSSPTSWKGAAVARFNQALPDQSNRQVISRELLNLREELVKIRAFEQYNRQNLFPVVDKTNYRAVEVLQCRNGTVTALHALPDGTILSAHRNGAIQVWRKNVLQEWETEELKGQNRSVVCLQGLPGNKIISGTHDGTISMWTKQLSDEWRNEVLDNAIPNYGDLRYLHALPTGEFLAGNSYDVWSFWQKEDGTWDSEELKHHGFVYNDTICILVLSKESFICAATNRLQFYKKDSLGDWTSTTIAEIQGDFACVQALSDKQVMASVRNGTIGLWNVNSDGEWALSGALPQRETTAIRFQALQDGKVVSGGTSNNITIYRKDTGSEWEVETLQGHSGTITDLQVLPNGIIISGSKDKTIRIWDGEEVT